MTKSYMPWLLAAFILPSAAQAQQVSQPSATPQTNLQMTAEERAMIDALPYSLRQEIIGRLGAKQNVRGLIETALLNRISHGDVKALRNVAVIYRAEAQGPDGTWKVIEVNPVTYAVIEPKRG